MDKKEVQEIIDCLPNDRTPFYYFKDRYALMLMGMAFDSPATKADVRRTAFAKLLDKPIVKEAMARSGIGEISRTVFEQVWPDDYACYLLALGVWGGESRSWCQTTRRGYNLVLQLNFSNEHNARYLKLVDPDREYPFEVGGHPIAKGKRRTLAWSRLDIDLDGGEALIEEIQNDWLREVDWALRCANSETTSFWYCGIEIETTKFVEYCDSVLAAHRKVWDEAMLAATIWFLREELGIRKIFYHTHRSGAALKGIAYRLPPRSLYTALPKRFCFERTGDMPVFLSRYARKGICGKRFRSARFQSITWN